MKKTDVTIQDIKDLLPALNALSNQELADNIAQAWIDAFRLSKWDHIEDVWLTPEADRKIRLIDHVNCIAELAVLTNDIIAKYHPEAKCDTELLVELALMHDVSKLYEFEPDGAGRCRHAEYSRRYQHGLGSYSLAVRYQMPEDLIHLIYAHADCCPIEPQLVEGHLFHHLDHCHFAVTVWGDTGTAKFKRPGQGKMIL